MRYSFLLASILCSLTHAETPPNIVWIVVEDSSTHAGCYGETLIETPNIDRLAAEGIRYTNAIVTCPVCSPSRSAMVSGMYQTTLGAHNHRSQRAGGKGGGNTNYLSSYEITGSIKLIPADLPGGGGTSSQTVATARRTTTSSLHRGSTTARTGRNGKPGQPFFAQFQLPAWKESWCQSRQSCRPGESHSFLSYYPDHPVLREDWARYLNSWIATDNAVGKIIVSDLEEGRRVRPDGDLLLDRSRHQPRAREAVSLRRGRACAVSSCDYRSNNTQAKFATIW